MASGIKRIRQSPDNETDEKPKDTIATFISKIWKILETEEYIKYIHWSDSGKTFTVYDYSNFARKVLPLYFKHSNFSSFVRQLNLYGFRKVSHPEQGVLVKTQSDEPFEFWHTNFRRGHIELLRLVQRKTHSAHAQHIKPVVKVQKVASPSDSDSEQKQTFGKVFEDIHRMQSRQENIVLVLEALKHDNQHLHCELKQLRDKSGRQQNVLNKIIQFLVHMVYNGKLPTKRTSTQLMLMDPSSFEAPSSPKRMRQTVNELDSIVSYNNLTPSEGVLDVPQVSVLSPESLEPSTPSSLSSLIDVESELNSPFMLPVTKATTAATPSPATQVTTLASSNYPTDQETSRALMPLGGLTSDILTLLPSIGEELLQDYPIHSAPSSLVSNPHPLNRMCINGVLNHQQNGIDAIPGMVGDELSLDPSLISEFLTSEDRQAPCSYDYVDTARLFESLSNLDLDTITDEGTLYQHLQHGTLPSTGVIDQDTDVLESLLADS